MLSMNHFHKMGCKLYVNTNLISISSTNSLDTVGLHLLPIVPFWVENVLLNSKWFRDKTRTRILKNSWLRRFNVKSLLAFNSLWMITKASWCGMLVYKETISISILISSYLNFDILARGYQCDRLVKLQKHIVRIDSTSKYNSYTEPIVRHLNF